MDNCLAKRLVDIPCVSDGGIKIRLLQAFPGGSDGKESACNAGDLDSVPASGRSPGEENGNPLQYSCLENPWAEEPSRLPSMVSQVGHNLASKAPEALNTMPVEKAMAPHSSTLAWKIPRMEGPGRLQSMGSLRVGYN